MSPFMQLVGTLLDHSERVHGARPESLEFVYWPGKAPDTWGVYFDVRDVDGGMRRMSFHDGTGEGAVRRGCEFYERMKSKE